MIIIVVINFIDSKTLALLRYVRAAGGGSVEGLGRGNEGKVVGGGSVEGLGWGNEGKVVGGGSVYGGKVVGGGSVYTPQAEKNSTTHNYSV